MGKYVVVHTHLKHGIEDEADIYAPGEEIELTEKEARRIGDNVRPAKGRALKGGGGEEEPAGEAAENLEDRTNAELIAMLGEGVEIPKKARKAELIELVKLKQSAGKS